MRGSPPLVFSLLLMHQINSFSGRKIIEILKKNPKKDPDGYGEGTSAFRFFYFYFFIFKGARCWRVGGKQLIRNGNRGYPAYASRGRVLQTSFSAGGDGEEGHE
jgi:hypothetical protein